MNSKQQLYLRIAGSIYIITAVVTLGALMLELPGVRVGGFPVVGAVYGTLSLIVGYFLIRLKRWAWFLAFPMSFLMFMGISLFAVVHVAALYFLVATREAFKSEGADAKAA